MYKFFTMKYLDTEIDHYVTPEYNELNKMGTRHVMSAISIIVLGKVILTALHARDEHTEEWFK